ncbi:MAG: hypothetical protein Q8J85_07165 [Sulfuricurvum sp.]|nr:hypothetical protein [Sulfuricurvum sp.]MDP3022994.1 hypothetical protein [Sulfuricurvum sp.]
MKKQEMYDEAQEELGCSERRAKKVVNISIDLGQEGNWQYGNKILDYSEELQTEDYKYCEMINDLSNEIDSHSLVDTEKVYKYMKDNDLPDMKTAKKQMESQNNDEDTTSKNVSPDIKHFMEEYNLTEKEAHECERIKSTYKLIHKEAVDVFKEGETPQSINKVILKSIGKPEYNLGQNKVIQSGSRIMAISYEEIIMEVDGETGKITFDSDYYSRTTTKLQNVCRSWLDSYKLQVS